MFTTPVCCGVRPHCGQSWDQPGRLASKNTANNPKARRNALFMTISFFCHLSEWSAAWGKRRRGGFPLTRFGKIAGGWVADVEFCRGGPAWPPWGGGGGQIGDFPLPGRPHRAAPTKDVPFLDWTALSLPTAERRPLSPGATERAPIPRGRRAA